MEPKEVFLPEYTESQKGPKRTNRARAHSMAPPPEKKCEESPRLFQACV